MRLAPALLASGLLIALAAPAGAREPGGPQGSQDAAGQDRRPNVGRENPAPASLGGAISGQEDAGRGGNAQKVDQAEGLRPR